MNILIIGVFSALSVNIIGDDNKETQAQVSDENLCPVNEKIEADMRRPESDYSKENAEWAIKKLQGIVCHKDTQYAWLTVPNAIKTVAGYILKKDAIKSKNSSTSDYHLNNFCTFMESSFWYD